MNEKGLIIIYNNNVEVKLIDNNVWMTQDQLVSLYQSSKSNISEHIKHILDEGELDENSTVRKFRIVQNEGERSKFPGEIRDFYLINQVRPGQSISSGCERGKC